MLGCGKSGLHAEEEDEEDEDEDEDEQEEEDKPCWISAGSWCLSAIGEILFAGRVSSSLGSSSLFHLPLVLLLEPQLLPPPLPLQPPPVPPVPPVPAVLPLPAAKLISDIGLPRTGEKAPPEERRIQGSTSDAAEDVSTDAIEIMPVGQRAVIDRFCLVLLCLPVCRGRERRGEPARVA